MSGWAKDPDARATFLVVHGRTVAMQVSVNGRPMELPEGTTVAALLSRLGAEATRVAVERNLDVVPRATYADVLLTEGDRLEIVTFVGGG